MHQQLIGRERGGVACVSPQAFNTSSLGDQRPWVSYFRRRLLATAWLVLFTMGFLGHVPEVRATMPGYTDTVWVLTHGCVGVLPYIHLSTYDGAVTFFDQTLGQDTELYIGSLGLRPTAVSNAQIGSAGNPTYFRAGVFLLRFTVAAGSGIPSGDIPAGFGAGGLIPQGFQEFSSSPVVSDFPPDGIEVYHRGQSFIQQFEAAFCNAGCLHPDPIPLGIVCP